MKVLLGVADMFGVVFGGGLDGCGCFGMVVVWMDQILSIEGGMINLGGCDVVMVL